ncbi:photosystem I reaction center subunit XI [Microcoleus vaginatus]|uniref:photosystem I reaction center subunit XI n=1 Tax=Microcoleus vaginatus TaxID=119532 RepID=UPI001683E788|nr:hypothetical protein [Microcoleus sp. FACHB-DQ6]MBD1885270.1 hypothetical protein [Microcoleus sp. FACHB-84]MBD2011250.1 hypothetical protein [Microcoleus sp. FACHB-45]
MSLADGYSLVGAVAVLIRLQEKGLTRLTGLLTTLALIWILSIALCVGDRPNLEKDKSFYWHKTPEDGSLFQSGFAIGGTSAAFQISVNLETITV